MEALAETKVLPALRTAQQQILFLFGSRNSPILKLEFYTFMKSEGRSRYGGAPGSKVFEPAPRHRIAQKRLSGFLVTAKAQTLGGSDLVPVGVTDARLERYLFCP